MNDLRKTPLIELVGKRITIDGRLCLVVETNNYGTDRYAIVNLRTGLCLGDGMYRGQDTLATVLQDVGSGPPHWHVVEPELTQRRLRHLRAVAGLE